MTGVDVEHTKALEQVATDGGWAIWRDLDNGFYVVGDALLPRLGRSSTTTQAQGVVVSEIRSQATPARDELAALILTEPNGWRLNRDNLADRILADGWSKPRTVNSVAELDALPLNTCGVDDGDHYWIRHSKNWHCSCDGTDVEWSSENLWEEINLGGPGTFTVLFTPGEAG